MLTGPPIHHVIERRLTQNGGSFKPSITCPPMRPAQPFGGVRCTVLMMAPCSCMLLHERTVDDRGVVFVV